MTCDPERIELFLRQQLSDEEQTAFELHLDDCGDCRRRLEETAAAKDVWVAVRDSLRSEQADLESPQSLGSTSSAGAVGSAESSDAASFNAETVLGLLSPTDDDRMLGRLGTYEVVGVIGSGGMGIVLKAFDAALNRYVAIKVLAPHLGSSGAARKRFSREAQAAAAVVHDNVIEIHGVADVDGLPYLVMPYLRGPSLQRRLDCEGPLALVEILRIAVQAATGLAAAHAQGLVHRDVKPANILLADGVERVKLTDFGLARAADDASLTMTGIIAGTPQYMSPEQARGESVDQRSDLFSLGSVLYAMCTGRAPFRAETSYGVLRRITDEEPRPIREINPDVPEWLCQIIAKLMSKQPDDRFESAREVAELLEACLAHVQQPTVVPLPASRLSLRESSADVAGRKATKFRRSMGVITMIAVVGSALLGMFLWQSADPPDIAGKWTGEEWGEVVLEQKQPGQYEGSYTDSDNAGSGAVRLKWSRIERRFNGTWREGDDRNGRISLRLVGDEIRGAWTTDEDSQKESGTPRLADLLWIRSSAAKTQRAEAAARARRAEAVAKTQFSQKAPLEFLSDVPEFRKLDLTITEDRLKQLVEEHHLVSRVTKNEKQTTYTLYTPKGERVLLTFRDGECSGVQRLRADPDFVRNINLLVPPDAAPKRVRHFAGLTTGNDVKIACSADGKLIAIANGNPTRIMGTRGVSRLKDDWKPSADILDAEMGKTVVSLKLSTPDEDAVLAVTERVFYFEVTALAFSPDGNVVVVGTSIGQVKLFDARTGELVRSLDDEPAKLADKETPENWKSLRRAMGSVGSLAFSPDGSLLATCGGSFADFAERFAEFSRMGLRSTGPGRLKLWDVQTGTLKHDLVGHNDHAYAVAFSPDVRRLASAGRWLKKGDFGNGVIIWNPRTGTQIHRLIRTTASGGTRSIAFSPDSKMLAMGTQRFDSANDTSTGGVSLVHVSSGVPEWLVTVPGWAKPVAFSPDGESVAVLCGERTIRFLETETGTMKHEIRPADSLQDRPWKDFAIAPQGHVLAIGAVDGERKGSVEVWSTKSSDNIYPPAAAAPASTSPREPTAAKAKSESTKHFTTGASVKTIACSADGKLVAVANGSGVEDDRKPSADILDAKTGKMVASLKLTTDEEDALLAAAERVSHFEVEALALSPDGNVAAVGTSIGQVKLFDARTGELVRSLDDERAKLADEKTPENWKSLRRAMGSARSLAFSPDGSLLATCGGSFADFARVFDAVERLGELGTGPGRLKVWEVKTGTLKHDLVGHSHAYAVSFSPDGSLLASAGRWLSNSRSGTGVILWNARTGAKVRTISTEANGGTHAAAFSPDGKMVAIGSVIFDKDKANDAGKRAISLAHVASGVVEWQRTFAGLAKPVAFYCDTPSPEGDCVVVLHGGRSMRFLDVQTGQTLFAIVPQSADQGGRCNDFVIARQGHMLAIGGVDSEGKGSVEVWDFDGPGS